MLGTIVNTCTILTGSCVGSFLGRGISEKYKTALFDALDAILDRNLNQLSRMGGNALAGARYKKFRQMGTV